MQMGGGEQHLDFSDAPLSLLVSVLSHSVGRTVIDKTGLSGKYNFNLHWTPDPGMGGPMMGGPGPGPGPGGPGPGPAPGGNVSIGAGSPASAPDSSGPSIFTALQEQAGLKLDSEKGPVDVIVIDHVDPPSPN